jgi:hypothetical protein
MELHRALADVDVVRLEGEALPDEADLVAGLDGELAGSEEVRPDVGLLDARLGRPGDQERRSRRQHGDGSEGVANRAAHGVTVTLPFISAPWTMQ